MVKKNKEEEAHKFGKRCGYELLPDGNMEIAPVHTTAFEEVGAEQKAINVMLQTLTKQCYELQKLTSAKSKQVWDRVIDDYSLDIKKFNYSYRDGVIIIEDIIPEVIDNPNSER